MCVKQAGRTRLDYVITLCGFMQEITLDYNQAKYSFSKKMPSAIMILLLFLRLTCELGVQEALF